MQNEILEKNLSYVRRCNPQLAQKILEIEKIDLPIVIAQNPQGQYNMLIDGVTVHDIKDAVVEAKKIMANVASNTYNTTHILFGLGLGYLFSEFCENAKGKIILYEPNIEILRGVLEIVNFEKEFQRSEVYIASDFNTLRNAFFTNFIGNNQVNLAFLNYHKLYCSDEINALIDQLKNFKTLGDAYMVIQNAKGKEFLDGAIERLEKKIFIPELKTLENILKNKPALIVSAGPSLAKNIELIKKNRNKFAVFCVGTAYKTLVKNGITPDFLNIIEMKNVSSQIDLTNTSKLNYICESYTSGVFYDFDFKRRFLTYSKENMANVWIANLLGVDYNQYETRGTVSYNALFSAKLLGCNPIVLIGQDLAYVDGQCYSKDSAYSTLKYVKNEKTGKFEVIAENFEELCNRTRNKYGEDEYTIEEIKEKTLNDIKRMNQELVTVKGVNGETLPTSIHYALFVKYFEEFSSDYSNLNLINVSGGADIKGFKNKNLEDVVKTLNEEFCVEDSLKKVQSYIIPDFAAILKKLEEEDKILLDVEKLLAEQVSNVKNFKLEIERHKKTSNLACKYLRKCLDALMKVIGQYYLKSRVLEILTFTERTELTFVLKEKDDLNDYQKQMQIAEKLQNFINARESISNFRKKIKKSIISVERVYESVNPKS